MAGVLKEWRGRYSQVCCQGRLLPARDPWH